MRTSSEVSSINRERKTITVKEMGSGREYEEGYDKLVFSPGAMAVRPPIPGVHSKGIFTLRNVPDTNTIKQFIEERKPSRAIIVGAGFIGLEMAENLHDQGIFVTVVEMQDQGRNILDYEMAAEVHQHLKTKNGEFYLKDGVSSFEHSGELLNVNLNSGRTLQTDMVILSIGVRPENELAKTAGLEIGKYNGIVVNKFMQTNDPEIYVVGDAVEFENPLSGTTGIIPLAGPANKQGRIVADNLVFGNMKSYRGTIATGIAKVFDLTVASTGLSEKALRRMNTPYKSLVLHSSSHAGYYPGAIIIPHTEVRERLAEIPADKPVVVFCAASLRGYLAERVLQQHGYREVYNLSGGYKTYSLATQEQSNEDIFEGYWVDKDDHIYQGNRTRK